jgi:prevent-host-death family protein
MGQGERRLGVPWALAVILAERLDGPGWSPRFGPAAATRCLDTVIVNAVVHVRNGQDPLHRLRPFSVHRRKGGPSPRVTDVRRVSPFLRGVRHCGHNDCMGGTALVGARELKTRLGRYLNRVRRGDTIIVTDRREPVAELRPIGDARDPKRARLARLAATGVMTLPRRRALAPFTPERLSGGSGAAAVSADRDERG